MLKINKIFILSITLVLSAISSAILAQNVKTKILCTTFPMYIFTQNITKNVPVEVELLLSSELGCPHSYSLSPKDMQRIATANILVINGLGMEEFLGAPIKRANSKLDILDSSLGVLENEGSKDTNILQEHDHFLEHSDNCEHLHSENCEHLHNSLINPHLFTSPRLAISIAKNIAKGLSTKTPEYAMEYQKNAQIYIQELEKLLKEMNEISLKLQERKIVTHHNIWEYFTQDMKLEVVAVIMDFAIAGKEPSASQMIQIVKKINAFQVKAIFTEPQYSNKVAKRIAQESKVPLAVLDPMTTGPQNPPLDYYQIIMRNNFTVLKNVLGYIK